MGKIRLQSKEEKMFEVDIEVAKMSTTIETMLEHLGNEEDGEVIIMPNISSNIMELVIRWCEHHVNKSYPEDLVDYEDEFDTIPRKTSNIPNFDSEMLYALNTKTLFELAKAANYLNIKGLLASSAKFVANMIKGQTPDKIRETFKITVNHDSEDESSERG